VRLTFDGDDAEARAHARWTIEMMQRPMRAAARNAHPLLRWGRDRVDAIADGFRRHLFGEDARWKTLSATSTSATMAHESETSERSSGRPIATCSSPRLVLTSPGHIRRASLRASTLSFQCCAASLASRA